MGVELLDHKKWHAKRTEFVYESGRLGCHKLIKDRAISSTEKLTTQSQVGVPFSFNTRLSQS